MKYAKSARKRALIIERAREVFSQKGYAKVTMKDIVDACGISRGGLYIYFDSTKTIFLEIFRSEQQKDFMLVEEAIEKALSAKMILTEYLERYKKNMIGNGRSLSLATFEFFLENKVESVIWQWQFDNMSEMFREIIEYGIRRKEFNLIDSRQWGRHIAQMIAGLNLTVPLLDFPEERIDTEIELMLMPLIK